jgi:hypothetical protein
MNELQAGLCVTCRFAKKIANKRGSLFIQCEYAKIDDRFPKYPRLPVLSCSAYQKENETTNFNDGVK